MGRRGALATVVFALLLASTFPARSLPIGPPSVTVTATPAGDPFSFDLSATASDPDGLVRVMDLCSEGGGSEVCRHADFPASPLSELTACLNGDEASLASTRDFGGFGIHAVRAHALAGGCPVLGANEEAAASQIIVMPPPAQPVACADAGTPGASDVGVSAERVLLGATIGESGPWSVIAAGARRGMQAAVHRINSTGGVCGRDLELVLSDDSSDPARGEAEIHRLVEEEQVFALVNMSSPTTLAGALPFLESAGVPVVGTMGNDAAEFASPLVWPAGPSHERFGELVVGEAYDAGARTFAIVWQDPPFGAEIRDAVVEAVAARPGATVVVERQIALAEPAFVPHIVSMSSACGGGCDAVVYAIDPTNQIKWFQSEGALDEAVRGRVTTALAQHLILEVLSQGCRVDCEGIRAWSGLDLAVGGAGPAAARYLEDVRALFGDAIDATNPFVMSGYLSVALAAEAMGRVGTALTRAGLAGALDAGSFDLGLTRAPLSWDSSREANTSMRAFRTDPLEDWRRAGGWVPEGS